ncbi:MAG TPA: hypothetical protein PKB14_21255 [Rubrivivax sp.]|nr:hypothetical protein [Rubrivivax sp.]
MHLVVPYAAPAAQTGTQAVQGLRLPQLERLLARLTRGATLRTEAASLNLPHEHLLAESRGWAGGDGCLPLAAWSAHADGLPPAPADHGWGLLTPSHWQVGSEQIVLLDPAQLELGEDESRALWLALQPLFEGLSWGWHWGAPLRWYATHASLAGLATASLDRVIGHGIEPWLPERRAGAAVRRLQSEAQMLLYTHPVNEAREARGALPVNSFWLSGTGRTQSVAPAAGEAGVEIDDALRAAWRAGDWAAWVEAWQTLDLQRLAELHARAARGEAVSLTLCGENAAQRFDSAHQSAWQRLARRWRSTAVDELLESL